MIKKWILAATFVATMDIQAQAEIQISHCLLECPSGTQPSNELVVREIYALSNNGVTKFADWVAYRVTKETIGTTASLDRDWKPDPLLDPAVTLEPKNPNDYKGSNSHPDLRTDRGHQAPMASFAGTIYWRTTNYLSNITPQRANLNQGPWKALEEAVRHAVHHDRQLFVVTGPVYERTMTSLPHADESHQVPSGYWKVISTAGGKMAAFFMDQDTARSADYCANEFKTTLQDIEQKAGIEVFPSAPANWSTGSLRTSLGC